MKRSLETRINYWGKELGKALEKKNEFFVLLGRIAYEGDYAARINHDDYTLACESITDLDAEIQSAHEESLRLEEQIEYLGDIHDRRNDLKKEIRKLKTRKAPLYESIGRSAWESWKSGSYAGQDIEKALKDLIRAEERLHAARDAVCRSNLPRKKTSLLTKGKIRFLSEKSKLASAAMERLWGAAGRKVSESIVIGKLAGSSMEEHITAIREIRQKEADIRTQIESLVMEAGNIKAGFPVKANLSAEDAVPVDAKRTVSSFRRQMHDNEIRLRKKRDSLESSYYLLAELWLRLSEHEKNSEIEQILVDPMATGQSSFPGISLARAHADCLKAKARIFLCRENRENLLYHKKYEDLKKIIKMEKNKIEVMKSKIKNRQSQIKELEKKNLQNCKDLDDCLKKLPPLPERDD